MRWQDGWDGVVLLRHTSYLAMCWFPDTSQLEPRKFLSRRGAVERGAHTHTHTPPLHLVVEEMTGVQLALQLEGGWRCRCLGRDKAGLICRVRLCTDDSAPRHGMGCGRRCR